MRRFWYAFGLAIAGGIFVTTALIVGIVMLNNANQIRQLDPEFIDLFSEALQTGALDDPERAADLQQLTIDYLEGSEGFEELVRVAHQALEPRTRLLLIAALVALPVGLITALLIGNYVSRPVVAVSDAARRVAAGDLSARATVRGNAPRAGESAELLRDFNKMAASLEQLENERQKMITDVAHELRTPLTIVQGQVDAMQYGVVPLDRGELAKLSRHIELLARLIKDLRVLSLADSRRLTLDTSQVDLAALSVDIVDGFQDQAALGGVKLSFETGVAGPVVLTLDGDRIAALLGDHDPGLNDRPDGPDGPGGRSSAPVVTSESRSHAVDVRWAPRRPREHIEPAVVLCVHVEHAAEQAGLPLSDLAQPVHLGDGRAGALGPVLELLVPALAQGGELHAERVREGVEDGGFLFERGEQRVHDGAGGWGRCRHVFGRMHGSQRGGALEGRIVLPV